MTIYDHRGAPIETSVPDRDLVGFMRFKVGPEHTADFSTIVMSEPRKLPNSGMTINMEVPRFEERVDENRPTIVEGASYFEYPPAHHAAIVAFAPVLQLYHSNERSYEGETPTTINIRQVVQNQADRYNVDPNDVAGAYPEARVWLGHKLLQHPESLSGLMTGIAKKTNRKVKT